MVHGVVHGTCIACIRACPLLLVQWRRELDAVLGGGAGTGGAASGEGAGAGGTSGVGGAGAGEGEGEAGAAEQLLCAQAIFDVLDTMHEWRTQHTRRNPISVNAVAIGTLLDAASLPQLVAAAMRCGAPCRALRYAEEHAAAEAPHRVEHVVGPGMVPMVRGFTASAVALIFPAYRRTLEPDGLLRAVHERTLEEEALEHEQQGRYSAALGCYQVMLQQEQAQEQAHAHAQWHGGPAQAAGGGQQEQEQAQEQAAGAGAGAGAGGAALLRWRLGLCRCLRHLGLLVQMKDSADGALRHARGEGEQLSLQSCALQAAWRLGRWADVHELAQGCTAAGGGGGSGGGGGGEVRAGGAAAVGRGDWAVEGEARFEAQLASAMHALQRREVHAVEAHCHAARRALAPLLVAASGASYIAAHPHVIRLQLLQESRHIASTLAIPWPALRHLLCINKCSVR